MVWLAEQGYDVYLPLGHSPDIDMIASRDAETMRVQVKTSRVIRGGRWEMTLCTRGGNQSWNGIVKRFSADRCDALVAVVAEGRRLFIPADEVGGGSHILLGGPKYEAFEVEAGPPLDRLAGAQSLSSSDPRRDSGAVKRARL